MAAEYDFQIQQGRSLNARLKLTNTVSGVKYPINLSGYNITGYINYNYCCTGSFPLNLSVFSSVSGYVDLYVSPSQSATFPVTILPYYIQVYSGTVYKEDTLFGDFYVNP